MRIALFLVLIVYTACTLPEEKKARQLSEKPDTTVMEVNDAHAALDTSNAISLPIVKKIKSYQLQEKYVTGGKDSIIVTEGTWMPSDGFIWLYKEQVARGKYKWKGDTLQYYSPVLQKNFSMHHLQDAMQNPVWKNKKGVIVFGIGNEPFWSVELDQQDSISFLLADWNHPVKMKAGSAFNSKDSIGYIAGNDSAHLRVTIFPHFCSDGMSDYVYRNKVRVHYNQKVYNGCAILYK
jgi:uncharacterized membrane protein